MNALTSHLRTRTVRLLYFLVASSMLIAAGLGVFILLSLSSMSAATSDLPLR
jgi:hypothetical protein